ncbi:MAG: BCCT family transporter [Pseudomonadota bacterium]
MDSSAPTGQRLDWSVFGPTLIVVLVCTIALVFFPETASQAAAAGRAFTINNLGWLFLFAGLAFFVFALWLAFGRFGGIKFGDPDEKPEYSDIHWVGMMFTAGVGGGLLVWGFAEPIFYIQTPPFGIEPLSPAAIEWAHMYPLFHWGLIPWALFAIPAVPIAYMLYVKKTPIMRISSACDGALPATGRAVSHTVIDIFIVIGIIGGTATALGLGAPLVSAFFSELLGIEDSLGAKMTVLGLWTLLFGISCYRGLKKGIRVLADINLTIAMLVIAFILVVGPTLFILDLSVNSLGLMLKNFWSMSLWTDPVTKSNFPQDWTVFYWTWWLAFSAYIGLFFGRISRGRTVKQLVLGVIFWGTLGTWTFLAVVGGYALYLHNFDLLPMVDILNQDGISVLAAKSVASMPLGKITLAVVTLLAVIFYATNIDSAAYVLASICTRDLPNNEEPQRSTRITWAILLALLTGGLISLGGIATIQASTIVSALPLVPITILMCVSLYRWLGQDTKLPP